GDGAVLVWGLNNLGQCNVPSLPAGLSYVEITCGEDHTIARRSDGAVVAWGDNTRGQCNVPALAAGLEYVEVAAGLRHSMARRSDGTVVAWGQSSTGQTIPPPVPSHLTCVEIAGGSYHSIARLSDASVVAWGLGTSGQTTVPGLPPGLGYVEVAGGERFSAARVGPPSSYVKYGYGCAGTMAIARLVPMDTPRIGHTLRVRLFNLPMNVAFLFMGCSTTTSSFGPLPLDLGHLGAPGCRGWNSIDAVAVVFGLQQAEHHAWIPDDPSLVGVVFHHQALVLDRQAPNALGAVMSNSAMAVVGR
ncbi:MAG: hypothetical protein FJ265_07485, partial [Planctomycetes bacterium]|nr:hypothetical protein [Planctomycetota bacterium]